MISSSTVFLEQPGPGPVLVPVGEAAELTCSVSEGNGVEWLLRPPDLSRDLSTEIPRDLPTLQQRDITVQGLGNTTSVLTIHNATANNGTLVRCVFIDQGNPESAGEGTQVKVQFYGKSS